MTDDLQNLRNLFVNRSDTYAVQTKDGYTRIDSPLTDDVIEKHLKGELTIGTYQFNLESKLKWICFDFDGSDLDVQFETAKRFYLYLVDVKKINPVLLEFSGMKGYHIWVFCEEIDGYSALEWAKEISKDFTIHEVFPKQVDIKDGYGNLVKLPLGIHIKSGKRTVLFDYNFSELSFEDSIELLKAVSNVERITIPHIEKKIATAVKDTEKKPSVIPESITSMIKNGVNDGARNKSRFMIIKELWNNGNTEEKITEIVLDFNSKCKPPEDIDRVKRHIKDLIEKSNQYLIRDVNDPYLIERNYISETVENKDLILISELLKNPMPEIKYWSYPLIIRGGLIIIGGRPGSFKSLFALSSALSMATKSNFLDTFTTENSPKILLYDLENGSIVDHMRLKYLLEGKKINLDSLQNFHLLESFDKSNMKKELAFASNYDIIILDSYRRFLKGEENASEITDEFYNTFFKPLKDAGKTVIIVHHFRKTRPEELNDEEIQNMFRGSSDIVGQVDLALGLFKEKEKYEEGITTFTVSVYKGKNRLGLPLSDFHFLVEKDDNKKETTLTYLGEKRFETPEISRINRIVEFLTKNGESRTREIMENFPELSTRTVTRLLTDAVTRGVIKSEKKGHYALLEDIETKVNEYAS